MSERSPKIVGTHVLLIRDGQIFLIRRSEGRFAGMYSLPAGHVDENESVTSASIREAREEVGVIIDASNLSFAHVMNRLRVSGVDVVDFFFSTENFDGEPKNCEPDKCDDARWFPLDQLPENTVPYIRQAIDCIRRRQSFSEFGW